MDERVVGILREAGVVVAYLFGSRARGDEREGSDADVAVLPGGHLGLLDRERLAMRLAAALEVPEVDVLVLEEAPLELRGRVVQEGKLIFSDDEPRRIEFEVRTRNEYFDFRMTLDKAHGRFVP